MECEGTLLNPDELETCGKALQTGTVGLSEFNEDDTGAHSTPEEENQEAISNLVKRYGGFIKRIDKNQNKIFTSPWQGNSILKVGALPQKYEDLLRKFAAREVPEISEDDQLGDVATENEMGLYNNGAAINEVKRYGGFLRKFGPKSKRNKSMEEGSQEQEGLQKRYGGFLRRIRPKLSNLKWDNQKRYGGFLRRHFKISVRSNEEPNSYGDFGL